MTRSINLKRTSGFTIVELLVVIVVIGILAAITIVSYTGISQKAKVASLQSDLSNASKQLKLFQAEDSNNYYPASIDCTIPDSVTNKCLKTSGSNSFVGGYTYNNATNPKTVNLTATNGTTQYRIMNDSAPLAVVPLTCPSGFINVPGSATYGTSDFCVMKYEAKQVGVTNVPISQAAGAPWTNIGQLSAITNSPNVVGCTGCHLIKEAEWLTIAQNLLGVASNWDNGAGVHTVGTGYIYSGHNDGSPINAARDADTNDSNGYYLTGNTSPSNQRRTLTLSNGEVIWDLAGNAQEWTDATIGGGQQPGLSGEVTYNAKEWNNGSLIQNGFPSSAMPGYTGISGAGGWSSAKGIGQLISNYGEPTGSHVYLRGGYCGNTIAAGVFGLTLADTTGNADAGISFRVTR